MPSRELTLRILGTSRGRWRDLVGWGGLPVAASDPSVETVQRLFSQRLRGTIASYAFAAGAQGRERVHLWRDGDIEREFRAELLQALPIAHRRAPAVCRELGREILGVLRSREIAGAWGRLQADGEDVEVLVSGSSVEIL